MEWCSAKPDACAGLDSANVPSGGEATGAGALPLQMLFHGDRLPRGTFPVHSRFRRCVNFACAHGLVSVVDATVGAGPFNIVLTTLPHDPPWRALTISHTEAHLGGHVLMRTAECQYDSSFRPPAQASPGNLWSSVERLEATVLAEAPAESLAFLLALDQPGRRDAFRTSFERAFAERMIEVVNLLRAGYVDQAVARGRGVGPGLTPSGDDFASGLLVASHVVEACAAHARRDVAADREQVLRGGLGESPFSNTFLGAAARGWLNAPLADLARALCVDDGAGLDSATRRLMRVGETSGADTAVGVVVGIKFWLDV